MSRAIFRAKYLAELQCDPIEDGCIIVQSGKIQSIGRFVDLGSPSPDHEIDGLLMPGLVNRHTHLELSDLKPPLAEPETFQDWILWVGSHIRRNPDDIADRIEEAVQIGINQCLKFGVTEAWDISQYSLISRNIIRQSKLRCTSFGECLGIGQRRERFEKLLQAAIDSTAAGGKLSIAISPHAPYTVDEAGYAKVFQLASSLGLPVMTHLAETEDESRFLLNHTGAFGMLYSQLGFDPGEPSGFYGSPVEWIRGIKSDSQPVWLAHVNYASDDDLLHLSKMNAKVVYCPRTHAYFGHPPHRWKEMLRSGIPVYLGTDSCASSPDLNLLDDLRSIHSDLDGMTSNQIYQMVSKPLLTGSPADLIAFETKSNNPLLEIIENRDILPNRIWIDGQDPYSGG